MPFSFEVSSGCSRRVRLPICTWRRARHSLRRPAGVATGAVHRPPGSGREEPSLRPDGPASAHAPGGLALGSGPSLRSAALRFPVAVRVCHTESQLLWARGPPRSPTPRSSRCASRGTGGRGGEGTGPLRPRPFSHAITHPPGGRGAGARRALTPGRGDSGLPRLRGRRVDPWRGVAWRCRDPALPAGPASAARALAARPADTPWGTQAGARGDRPGATPPAG